MKASTGNKISLDLLIDKHVKPDKIYSDELSFASK